jgi:hypothetical protein
MLAGPSSLIDAMDKHLGLKDDCSNFNSMPRLGFALGAKVLNLQPEDYIDKSEGQCSTSFMALDVPPPRGPLFVFGDPFLRRFLTIYDHDGPSVGFAVAKHAGSSTAMTMATVVGSSGSSAHETKLSESAPKATISLDADAGQLGGAADQNDQNDAPTAMSTTVAAVHEPVEAVAHAEPKAVAPAEDDDFAKYESMLHHSDQDASLTTAAPQSAYASFLKDYVPDRSTESVAPATGGYSNFLKGLDPTDAASTPSVPAPPTSEATRSVVVAEPSDESPMESMKRIFRRHEGLIQAGESTRHSSKVRRPYMTKPQASQKIFAIQLQRTQRK